MQRCILRIIKEDQKTINPSILKYHRDLRRELGEGLITPMESGMKEMIQKILGEDWKEEEKIYIARLEEEDEKKVQGEKRPEGRREEEEGEKATVLRLKDKTEEK